MSSDLVTVDNTDVNNIHYDGPANGSFWDSVSPPNDPNIWGGTLMEADAAGLSAVFKFKGSQVFVVGRVEPPKNGEQPPVSLYSVGDTKFQAFPAPTVSSPTDNVSFFNSSVMPYGEYTLIINVTLASSNSPYFLDYIRYNITDPSAQPPATSASATSTSSGAATSSTGASSPSKGSSSSTPIGPIVGGVVAGVAVIAAAIIAFLCCRMRRRRPIPSLSPTDPAAPSLITPYMVPGNAGSHSRFSDLPAVPYSPTMRQTGSMYSLGTTAVGEPTKSPLSGKALAARMDRQAAYSPTVGSAYAGSSAGDRSTSYDGGAAPVAPSSVTGGGTTYSRTHSSPMSSVHDLPNFVPRGQGHTKGTRSESTSLLAAGGGEASGSVLGVGANAQEDSGLRFQPGLTPSDVAPVLPPGTVPIRSTATMSEVARADIPPAYTPD